jgi:hypothetical protein
MMTQPFPRQPANPVSLLALPLAVFPVDLARLLGLLGGRPVYAELVSAVTPVLALGLLVCRKRRHRNAKYDRGDRKSHADSLVLDLKILIVGTPAWD